MYSILSICGRYEPAAWGLNGVKWYNWAPYGFVGDKYKWKKYMIIVFLPLWTIDRFYIHSIDDAYSGKYPINEIN
jgi:hypothetical protein